uniref:Uncharacterized protein n=1 Tax=Fagus sylvatica TaxID=28930 RepID=A0A2N9EHJ0_FAGSY
MEIVISIAAKVVEYTVAPVVQWLGYSFRYSSNMENVKKQEQKLQGARERVQHTVDAAKNNAEKIETDVDNWLKEVDSINGNRVRKQRRYCKISKMSYKMASLTTVSYRDASQGIVTTTSTDYMTFESRMSTMNQLMETLRDSNINIIGVWGMAGVGKSTLVREVAKKVKEERLFDEVAIAIVKQNPDQRRIQGEIADKLDLKLDKETLSGRADLLRERLTRDKNKKILVILDDIWEKLDLEEIGNTPGISEYFQMHDLALDVALLIAYKTQNVLAMRDEGPVEWPDEDDIKMCTTISIFEKDIHELPDKLECPDLRCLILPREIGNLTRLRMLDLSFTQWEVEGLNNERASLAELKHLSQLTTLEVHIPDANILPKDLIFEKLKRYKIFIGDVWDWSDNHENKRALKLKLNTSFQLESGIKLLLNGIEDLCLDELKGVESIIYELDTKGFQQLKNLHVQNNVEIKNMSWPTSLDILPFRNLRIVKVEHCEKLKFAFSSSIAKGLSQLQELEIRECSIMGAIVLKEEGGVEDRDMILLPQLRRLVLHRLPKLMSFLSTQKSVINDAGEIIPECDLDFHMPILLDQVVFPNLETLELSYIDSEEILQNQHRARSSFKLTNIQTKSRFQNLRSLKVEGSGSLKYLLSSSTARVMEQLKYLSIKDCKVMEEILLTEDLGEEEEIIPKVLFPQLNDLTLKDLPVLKRFCVGSIIVSKELKEMNSEEISLTTMQPLFNEEVSFPSLETLIISHMENLKIIWHNQLAEDSFFKLQRLAVQFCENVMSIFQSNMLTRFQSLEKLIVYDCGSFQEIFELQGQDVRETQAVTTIPLKELVLRRLPKMKQVWNKDPQGIFSFQNLQEIIVMECESLKSLFPANLEEICHGQLPLTSFRNLRIVKVEHCEKLKFVFSSSIAKGLSQLQELEIRECSIMGAIVLKEEAGVEDRDMILLPQLRHLVLHRLPKLMSFLSTQKSVINDAGEIIPECDLDFHMPILLDQVAFPSLETLKISHMENLKIIWHNQLAEGSFFKLKILEVECCENLMNIFQSNMLTRFQSLEKLIVGDCGSLQELPREIGQLTHLRLLDLSNCSKLEVIPSNVLSRLIQLEELYVRNSFTQWEVEGLNNERASLAELKHLSQLTTLEVHIPDANMLPKDLLFERLKRYKIFIGDVWDWSDKHENSRALKLKLNTSFQLESGIKLLLNGIEDLCLDELKGVKSIIYELDTEGFQQLKRLHVQNNVEIKYIIDSRGLVIDYIVFPALEIFSLKNMNNLEEICHGQLPLTSFCNLRIVKVEHCEKLKFAFSSSIAKGLSQLQELEIRECSIMGAIVLKEEAGVEDRDMILLPQLRHLVLHRLPKLMSFLSTQKSVINDAGEIIPECDLGFSHANPTRPGCVPQLGNVGIVLYRLGRVTAKPTSGKVVFQITNIQTKSRFQNLWYLNVEGSGSLKYLLSSSTARVMEQLKYLYIENCKVMEEVLLSEDLGEEEEIIPNVLFPRLNALILKDLPVLKRFCVGSNIKFPSLKDMRIEHCPKLKSFILKPASSGITVSKEVTEMNSEEISLTTMQPLFNEESLEKLVVQDCGSLQEIFELQGQDVRETQAVTAIPLKELDLRRLLKMKQDLQVVDCGAEEIVAQEYGAEAAARLVFPKVTFLLLSKLPKLKWFYQGVHTSEWPLLKTLRVNGCDQIEIFISKSLSFQERVEESQLKTSIQQPLFLVEESLEKLIVQNCGSLQEIFELQGQDVRETQAVTAIPLKELDLYRLPKMKQVWNKDPQGVFSFQNLQKIIVGECESLKSLLPASVARCLMQLKDLQVVDCGAEEIVAQEYGAEAAARLVFPKVTFLLLSKLPKLKWFYQGVHTSEWPLLKTLRVNGCDQIEIFISKSLSFQERVEESQLKTSIQQPLFLVEEDLHIVDCGVEEIVAQEDGAEAAARLVFPKVTDLLLFTPSTAKSLVQLKKLSVSECESITEVVAGEGGEGNEVITFSQLTYLKLDCLPNLTSFCSRSYSFEFPSLEEVIVSKCPEMKIFCHGILSTPKLERVQATKEDEWHWKVDLNTTVRTLALEGQTMIPLCNSSSE